MGAEGLVRGSASLASQLGLRGLVIGLTVVAFGTSTPELMVGVKATHDGFFAISLGERGGGGSNICNIALILGLWALIRPLHIDAQAVRLQIPIMIPVSLILMLVLLNGGISRLEGTGLIPSLLREPWFYV